jgi:hypothetical protein
MLLTKSINKKLYMAAMINHVHKTVTRQQKIKRGELADDRILNCLQKQYEQPINHEHNSDLLYLNEFSKPT